MMSSFKSLSHFTLLLLLSASVSAFAADSASTQADAQSPWWLGHAITAMGTLVAAGMIVYRKRVANTA